MALTATHTVGLRKRQRGAEDAHGNPVDSYGPAQKLAVYSIAPAFSDEPFESGRQAVVTGYTILAPTEVKSLVTEADVVVIDGNDYTVEGEVALWDRGPFDYTPGVSFSVKRVTG